MNQVVTPIQPSIVTPVVKTPAWGGQGSTDLQRGIEAGNVEQVLDAVKVQEVSVHEPLPNGELPLCFAAKLDSPDMAQELMKLGASPGQKDSHGYTPIEHAAFLKKEKVFPCLMRATVKSEVDALREEYSTVAAGKPMKALSHRCERIAQLTPIPGKEPSLNALRMAAFNGNLEALRAFDGDVDARDLNGLTAMHYALLGRGGLEALNILLSKGANPHLVTESKETYLHFAALSGKTDCVAKLGDHGLEVTKTNNAQQSPLHFAMARTSSPQYWSMYDALVQRGAKPTLKDQCGISPLHLIKKHVEAKNPNVVGLSDGILLASSMTAWGTFLASQCGLTTDMPVHEVASLIRTSFAVHEWTEFYKILSNDNFLHWLGARIVFPALEMGEFVPFIEAALGTEKIAASRLYVQQNMRYLGMQGVRHWMLHTANIIGAYANAAVRAGLIPLTVYGGAGYGGGGYQPPPPEPTVPMPENWKDLPEKERILHEGLNPKNHRHAEKILHCDKAKVDRYPSDTELEAREAVSGKLAQCKEYKSCLTEAEHRRNELCEQLHQPNNQFEEDTPAFERATQNLEACQSKPISSARCKWEHLFFNPDECETYQETAGKVSSAYKSALKGCYRELALKWHPDKNKDPQAEEAFKRIGESWETLTS